MFTSMIWHAQRIRVWTNYRYVISLLYLPHLNFFGAPLRHVWDQSSCTPEGTWFSSNRSCLESRGEFSGLIWFRRHSYRMEAIENELERFHAMKDVVIEQKVDVVWWFQQRHFFVVVNWTSMGIVCNITKQGMGKDQLALIVFTVV